VRYNKIINIITSNVTEDVRIQVQAIAADEVVFIMVVESAIEDGRPCLRPRKAELIK
jgi:hypothetical protein